jgi:hypothetical protein
VLSVETYRGEEPPIGDAFIIAEVDDDDWPCTGVEYPDADEPVPLLLLGERVNPGDDDEEEGSGLIFLFGVECPPDGEIF